MQVSDVTCLTYRGGPQVMLSESLIHIDENPKNGSNSRLAATHWPNVCLVTWKNTKVSRILHLLHHHRWKQFRTWSRQQFPSMMKEKQTFLKMIMNKLPPPYKPTKKKMLRTAPDTVDVMLGDACVTFKTPSSWKEVILVPLEPGPLTLVCDWIMQDIGNCLSQKRRNYTKSGNFSKKARVDKDDDSSEWLSWTAGLSEKTSYMCVCLAYAGWCFWPTQAHA